MRKVRIAFFLDVLKENFDGVSITMHQVIRRIPKDQFEAIFITSQMPSNSLGFPVYECPSFEIPINKDYPFAMPKKMKGLDKILSDFDPDIVHWSSPSALGSYAVKYGMEKQLRITTIYHTHFPSFANYYLRFIPRVETITEPIVKKLFWLYRESTRILAPTPTMKEYLIGKDVPESNIVVWGRGVNTEQYSPHHRDTSLWPDGKKKVLFVSRLVKEKEPNTLIRLYKLFEAKRPDIRMVITGEGPTKAKLQKNMPEALFTGKLTGEDLAKAYASSDVFVFPSTTETFGNVVLEALASGLPVVAANAGGPSDIIKDGQTGILVEPKNEQAFFDEITRLIDDPSLHKTLQQNAVEYAKSQNWDSLCAQLFDQYRMLV